MIPDVVTKHTASFVLSDLDNPELRSKENEARDGRRHQAQNLAALARYGSDSSRRAQK
jgi:hypothetical protein